MKTFHSGRGRDAHIRSSLALAIMMSLCGSGALHAGTAAPAGSLMSVGQPTLLSRGDAVMGALPMNAPMRVEVALKMRNKADLDALVANNAKLQAQGLTPQWLTSAQFMANHAPSALQAQAVADYLTRMGYTNVTITPDRMLVKANGTASTARNAFATTFAQVRTSDGRIAFANTDDVRIPAAFGDSVLGVMGLQNVHIAHTTIKRSHPANAHTDALIFHAPTEFPAIYGAGTSAAATGVLVGIVTDGNLATTKSDLADFTAANGLPAVSTLTYDINGTSNDTTNIDEWDLDSQDVVGMSGGVKQLLFYNMPSLSYVDLNADFEAIEVANRAKVINVSLGGCETDVAGTGGIAAIGDGYLEIAAAQGQTVSASTGDHGADECENGTNSPEWPASSPYVVAVAGTSLNASTTTWNSETVWLDSGGSPSTFEPMPAWQTTLGVSGSTRVAADVAFDANPNSGAIVYYYGNAELGFGGTSLASPLFVGLWARVLQVHPTIGFAAPVIYALPTTPTSAFHDIVSGNNNAFTETGIGFTAKVGYDDASGRGSMIIANVIADSATLGDKPPVANFNYTTGGMTASFTDASTDSDDGVYSYAWKFGDGTTSTAPDPVHTYAVNGNYTVSETVKDEVGAAGYKNRVVSIMPVDLLKNSGFESGASSWSITPASILTNSASGANSGNWYVAIGNDLSTTDKVFQTVTIPAGKVTATLNFYLHVTTNEVTTTASHDNLLVDIGDASGKLIQTLATYSNLNTTPGYVMYSLDMSAFIGQKVRIAFYGTNNSTLPTTWNLDDVSLMVQ